MRTLFEQLDQETTLICDSSDQFLYHVYNLCDVVGNHTSCASVIFYLWFNECSKVRFCCNFHSCRVKTMLSKRLYNLSVHFMEM